MPLILTILIVYSVWDFTRREVIHQQDLTYFKRLEYANELELQIREGSKELPGMAVPTAREDKINLA